MVFRMIAGSPEAAREPPDVQLSVNLVSKKRDSVHD
jgi:hypothetical protein